MTLTDAQADRVEDLMGRYPATDFQLVSIDPATREATFETYDFGGATTFVMSADARRVQALRD